MPIFADPPSAYPYAAERIYTPPDATIESYRHLLGVLGVDRAVLIQPSVYGTDNRAMLAALRAAGPGFRGVAVVEPGIAAREVEALHQAGIRGVRLNLVDRREGRNAVPLELVRALAERIAPFGWHIEFLVNLDEAPGFAEAVAGLGGADRARPSGLSARRRARLDQVAGVRGPAVAARRRPLLGQADRPLPDFGRARSAL